MAYSKEEARAYYLAHRKPPIRKVDMRTEEEKKQDKAHRAYVVLNYKRICALERIEPVLLKGGTTEEIDAYVWKRSYYFGLFAEQEKQSREEGRQRRKEEKIQTNVRAPRQYKSKKFQIVQELPPINKVQYIPEIHRPKSEVSEAESPLLFGTPSLTVSFN